MIHRACPVLQLTIALLTLSVLHSNHAAASVSDPYTRVSETESGLVTLEMCERTLKPSAGEGPRIHLISAIHIADKQFYEAMQDRLELYDTVLFEGVKPAGLDAIDPELDDESKAEATRDRLELLLDISDQFHALNARLPEGIDDLMENSEPRIAAIVGSIRSDGWDQPIITSFVDTSISKNGEDKATQYITFTSTGADRQRDGTGVDADISLSSEPYSPNDRRKAAPEGIQTQLANALRVSFQLDEMDMTNPKWINADMDINELQEQLANMGEGDGMILDLIEGNSFQAKLMGFALKFVARSPTMSSMMKLVMMDMLALMESSEMLSQFEEIESVILHGRNNTVIDYLNKELAKDTQAKDIAIFYGAAHMPGLEETIINDLGYEFESDTWTQAMAVSTEETSLSAGQIKMMRNMIKNALEQQF